MLNKKDKIKIFKKIINSLDAAQDTKSKKMRENLYNAISKSELDEEQINMIFHYLILQVSSSFKDDIHININKTLYTGSSPYIVQVYVLLKNACIILKKYNFSENEIEYIIKNTFKFSKL